MNDLDLLETYGPAATPLRDDVLSRARAAVLDEAANAPLPHLSPATSVSAPRLVAPNRRRLTVGLVAACAAAAALLGPSLLGLHSSGVIALAPRDPLSFPLTPASVPAGLGEPIFELDSGFMSARYGAGAADGVTVTTNVVSRDYWSIPEDTQTVDISGRAATLFDGVAFDGTAASTETVSVVWQSDSGDWTRVTGRGRFADPDRVRTFAESLLERPQQVNLSLEVAPEGWSVVAYKDDRILRLSPDQGPTDVDLTVSLVDDPPDDFESAYGVDEVTTERVHGADAQVGRSAEGWIALAVTPGGTTYSVSAPEIFSRDQVIAVAGGVTFTP